MEYVDQTHPSVVPIPYIYRSFFRNYHAQFWDEINRGLLFDLTNEPTHIAKYYRIKGFMEMDWLGICFWCTWSWKVMVNILFI